MKLTASRTVLRFLTSSSGMRTPNFSSALTTMVIIDSESMSRSSVKDLSSSTEAVSRPVSSLTISARPSRISFSLCAMRLTPCCRRAWWDLPEVLSDPIFPPGRRELSGQNDDLRGVDQPGAEGDLQGQAAVWRLTSVEHALGGQRDRGCRGVAGLGDVAGDGDVLGQLELLDEGIDDAHVGLVGDEHIEVVGLDAGPVKGSLGYRSHGVDRPAEHRLARHRDGRPSDTVVAYLDP